MKTTLSLFLYGLLSATAAIAAPTTTAIPGPTFTTKSTLAADKTAIELAWVALEADGISLPKFDPRSSFKTSRSSLNTTGPARNTTDAPPTTTDLKLDGANGTKEYVYTLSNFPVNSILYAIGGGHAIEKVHAWTHLDQVWCGFGGANGTGPNMEYEADNSTTFHPAFVITTIRCWAR